MGNSITNTNGRKIKEEEKVLITTILELAGNSNKISSIPDIVYDLDDGGMGTIKLTNNKNSIFGKELLVVNYIDSDNTTVIIALTIDKEGDLFELDFWKVNFEKLLRYPKPNDIEIVID